MNGRRCQEMQLVRVAIKQEHQHFQELGLIDRDYPDFFYLLNKKVNSLPLRGYFSKKLLDYIREEYPKLEISPALIDLFPGKLPFVVEVVITIQYYHNQILDGKGGVLSSDRIKQNLLLSNLLKDQLYSYIDARFQREQAILVADYVRKMFKYTDIGQLIEKTYNTYKAYNDTKDFTLPYGGAINTAISQDCIDFLLSHAARHSEPGNDSFLRLYFIRIYLVSAMLFKLTAQLIKDLIGLEERNQLRGFDIEMFSEYYGVMLQLVNDNCDWIPSKYQHKTVAKNYSDSFCDLRNKNVTFPLFIYLQRSSGAILNYLEEEQLEITPESQDQYYDEIIETGAIKEAIRLGKDTGQKALSYLNPANSNWVIFEDMVKISHYNRYYYHFFEEMKNYQIKMY